MLPGFEKWARRTKPMRECSGQIGFYWHHLPTSLNRFCCNFSTYNGSFSERIYLCLYHAIQMTRAMAQTRMISVTHGHMYFCPGFVKTCAVVVRSFQASPSWLEKLLIRATKQHRSKFKSTSIFTELIESDNFSFTPKQHNHINNNLSRLRTIKER